MMITSGSSLELQRTTETDKYMLSVTPIINRGPSHTFYGLQELKNLI